MKAIIIFVLFILVSSCAFNEQISERRIEPFLKTSDQLPDSSFVGQYRCIEKYKNKYYITDISSNCFIIYDNNMNYLKRVGRSGSGPGEFMAPSQIKIINDSLYVLDGGNKRVNIYDLNGKYSRTFGINILSEAARNCRSLVILNNKFIVSTPFNDNIITEYGFDKQKLNGYGNKISSQNNQLKYVMNSCFVAVDSNNYIVALRQSKPLLERYDKSGNMIDSLSLLSVPEIRNASKNIDDCLLQENLSRPGAITIIPLFSDITISKDKIFISLAEKAEGDNGLIKGNKILVVDYNKDKMTIKEILIPTTKGDKSEQLERLQYIDNNLIQNDITNNILYFYKYY